MKLLLTILSVLSALPSFALQTPVSDSNATKDPTVRITWYDGMQTRTTEADGEAIKQNILRSCVGPQLIAIKEMTKKPEIKELVQTLKSQPNSAGDVIVDLYIQAITPMDCAKSHLVVVSVKSVARVDGTLIQLTDKVLEVTFDELKNATSSELLRVGLGLQASLQTAIRVLQQWQHADAQIGDFGRP